MQDMGRVTVYDTNSTCKNGEYPNIIVVNRKFNGASDATDADVRVEFGVEVPTRTILWANELSDKVLECIVGTINY